MLLACSWQSLPPLATAQLYCCVSVLVCSRQTYPAGCSSAAPIALWQWLATNHAGLLLGSFDKHAACTVIQSCLCLCLQLPASFFAYRKQQHRWTCGPVQLWRKAAVDIWDSSLPMICKLDLIVCYFGIRKFATHWVSLGFFCTLVPLSIFTPEVSTAGRQRTAAGGCKSPLQPAWRRPAGRRLLARSCHQVHGSSFVPVSKQAWACCLFSRH